MMDHVKAIQDILIATIEKKGPMSVQGFMDVVLAHPEHGYYMRQDPFGIQGDFTTAPEISQMFGEMIGLWLADAWMQAGSPSPFIMLECGPGRGTLMSDILRMAHGIPGFLDAVQIHLVEMSPVLREKQKSALQSYDVTWHMSLETVPEGYPLFFVANEFFDALPIQQFEYRRGNWNERLISYENGEFSWLLDLQGTKIDIPVYGQEGDIYEYSIGRAEFIKNLAKRLKKQSGVGLVIDYGHTKTATGDTLQAVHKHKFCDVLGNIGDADLTSHVDFEELKSHMQSESLLVHGPSCQGDFLQNMGIKIRAQSLLKIGASQKQKDDIEKAMHRLCAYDEMGRLFKVLGVHYGFDYVESGF